MENLDKNPSELDAISAASDYSQVSSKNKENKKKNKISTHFYWLIGAAVAMVMVLVLSLKPDAGTHRAKIAGVNKHSYSSSLNANLARLRELSAEKLEQRQAQKQEATTMLAANNIEQPLAAHSAKEMAARQHAPTSMYYSNPVNHITQPNTNAQLKAATFAGQGANTQFANTNTTTTSVTATKLSHPNFTIAAGEFLHAVLETAINSDLPGMVRAVVSKPAYSYNGERAIIPAGSRLIGQYSSATTQGQNRVMIIWSRIILPSGITVQLNSPGTDMLGRAGQGADSVNRHFFARFAESALLSLIGAGAATSGVSNNEQYNSASQYRMAIAQSFQQSAQQSLQGSLSIKPTLHIYQGTNINIFVAHDLSFYQVLKKSTDSQLATAYFIK